MQRAKATAINAEPLTAAVVMSVVPRIGSVMSDSETRTSCSAVVVIFGGVVVVVVDELVFVAEVLVEVRVVVVVVAPKGIQ